jgi:DNA-binding beta-propeller fold protein YncE
MRGSSKKKTKKASVSFTIAIVSLLLIGLFTALVFVYRRAEPGPAVFTTVRTLAGAGREFGEPFAIAVKGNEIYISDGEAGKIWKFLPGDGLSVFAYGLDTPSGIAFDKNGDLIVADPGSHTVKRIDPKGNISLVAGIENRSGFADGDTAAAMFNAPIGVTVSEDGKIYVADTYNDRIRVIEGGKVSTLAGREKGFAEGRDARFDTPCALTVWKEGLLLVADTGNRRIRVVETDGQVWTLAGSGEADLKDGLLPSAALVDPTAIALSKAGEIFIADGNAVRMIGLRTFPYLETISSGDGGLADGVAQRSRFNHPTGLAFDASGDLLAADSENQLIRVFSNRGTGSEITPEEKLKLRYTPEEFKALQPPRWPYDPPARPRDIAGTLGELRGEVTGGDDSLRFHNGLDIAGSYGETARFIRDEKVLWPVAADNFESLRELIRMPTIGYIHIRIGRSPSGEPFPDGRFQFQRDNNGRLSGLRVPRGTKFRAGEPIGTLNAMNHVHLVAGRSGAEMNAIDALVLPGAADSRAPVIDKVSVFDENWREIETATPASRIKLVGKIRIVARAFDQMDGNNERRRLGIYRAGYQIMKPGGAPVTDIHWTIGFDRMPAAAAAKFAYAKGSKSGATGETIFNYIVSNTVSGDTFHEDFFDAGKLEQGIYFLRVFISDYFGNTTTKDINFEV